MNVLRSTLLLASFLLVSPSWADHGGRENGNNNGNGNNRQFSSAIVGSSPGTMIGGVAAGGLPWVVASGNASLDSSGNLEVKIMGLLLGPGASTLAGTVGSVQMVSASLVCGGSGGVVAASTGGVALNASGNAEIESALTLPTSCVAPAVLIRIFNPAANAGAQAGAFIASTGVAATSNPGVPNNDGDNEHGGH